jgi:hypothetical protein
MRNWHPCQQFENVEEDELFEAREGGQLRTSRCVWQGCGRRNSLDRDVNVAQDASTEEDTYVDVNQTCKSDDIDKMQA